MNTNLFSSTPPFFKPSYNLNSKKFTEDAKFEPRVILKLESGFSTILKLENKSLKEKMFNKKSSKNQRPSTKIKVFEEKEKKKESFNYSKKEYNLQNEMNLIDKDFNIKRIEQNDREQWNRKTEFLLAIIGFSVDLGNVWRCNEKNNLNKKAI